MSPEFKSLGREIPKPEVAPEEEIKSVDRLELPPERVEILPRAPGQPSGSVRPIVSVSTHPARDQELQAIENILAEGLEKIYQDLPASLQGRFREKGEEVAGQIWRLLEATKVKAQQILELIRGWLRLIPGVNRFFLEQESKIKTDKILTYVEKRGPEH